MKLLIFASLLCVDSTTRDKLLDLMTGVSQNAFANETGVLKFGLFFPREEPNDKLLYSIEEYANQAAFDSHLASGPVVEMFKWINSANIYSRPAEFYSLDSSPEFVTTRPELGTAKDPYVVVRQTNYLEGKRELALPAWTDVVSAASNETGSLLSGIYTDPTDSKRMFTIDVSVSKQYWLETHLRSKAYVEAKEISKSVENGTEVSILKLSGGFLYKPE
ncbi:hypothetical protein VTL71DRAFT_12987 [Oculimacula yallundae]|uniref:ABM domain-containing protein n=1 Tax=Oculimacula yallundae TaxID=86028 RepID=A0ABR4CP18_9HELO